MRIQGVFKCGASHSLDLEFRVCRLSCLMTLTLGGRSETSAKGSQESRFEFTKGFELCKKG